MIAVGALWLWWAMGVVIPSGFLPSEDQGGFFVALQLPDGASVARTSQVMAQVEKNAIKRWQGVADTFAIVGFSILDSAQESNSGFMFVRLKPFADRRSAQTQVAHMIGAVFGMGNADTFGQRAGVQSAADHRAGDGRRLRIPARWAAGAGLQRYRQHHERADRGAHASPKIGAIFSTFTASNPSLFLDIDREKAQALGLNMSDVFAALQATLGGIYINDFNLYGRVWQVNIQGEAYRPQRCAGAVADLYAQQDRRDGAAALDRRGADQARAAGDHAV